MTAIASTHARGFLALCLAELGEFAEGAIAAEEAVRIAEEQDHPHSIGWAYLTLGYVHLIKGDVEPAIVHLARARTIFQHSSAVPWLRDSTAMMGHGQVQAGRVAQGMALLEHDVTEYGATAFLTPSRHTAWLAEAALLAGRLADAASLAARALVISRSHQTRGDDAWTLRLLGEIAAHADSCDEHQAETCYRQAQALAQELEMRPLVAHCYLGLGTLYRKLGRHEQAQTELATAAEMYRVMEMSFWLEKAEAALSQVAG
jgi:tetratricopeptide (TPR) repeat protein